MSATFRLDIQQVAAGDRSAWLIEDHSVPVSPSRGAGRAARRSTPMRPPARCRMAASC